MVVFFRLRFGLEERLQRSVYAVLMKFEILIPIAFVAIPATAVVRDYESRPTKADITFFEQKIRPVLSTHCYECHSAESKKLKGGLRLDIKAGWQIGGDSGEPAIVPGKPELSPLIRAVRHEQRDSAMPPNKPKLPDRVIADLVEWVRIGAPDPRTGTIAASRPKDDWETLYRQRLNWWSLQPLSKSPLPAVRNTNWPHNEVDRFVLAKLESRGLSPAPQPDRRTLARRLSFALTGLPPKRELMDRFLADRSPEAYRGLVKELLDSPHFGEHWARHWMDVVHYADTHGYEWDAPAKNAWMYRDYLIRAFNTDLPFNRFLLEQLAGDLIEPRVDAKTGLVETLIAPMALRLGERRHGDNAAAEGVTQEAMANIIDTVGKGFIGTTVACAQCHDHKLDAVAQRDYYALMGVFMSSRYCVRSVDAVDPNVATIEELRRLKREVRDELARLWKSSSGTLAKQIAGIPRPNKPPTGFPDSIAGFANRMKSAPITAVEFNAERQRRIAENKANLKLLADFTKTGGEKGWRWEGFGMKHGLVGNGEIVVADEGNNAISQILPAGRWSHVWSKRLAGALRSPQLERKPPMTFSVGYTGGKHAAQSMIVDQSFHCERMVFLNKPSHAWLTMTAGNFDTLAGGVDRANRRVYFEVVTKSLNNYFPPRVAYGGLKETDVVDPRSWFGVTRIYQHPPGKPPLDELARFVPLFADDKKETKDWAAKLAVAISQAIDRWSRSDCTEQDALLLNDAQQLSMLPGDLRSNAKFAKLVSQYRDVEVRLQPDRTVGSVADWDEGRDERIGVRGSYTDFADGAPRGNIRFLGGAVRRAKPTSCGRLELAKNIVGEKNPLTARVFVNRVWLHLFGEGLVRSPDDFGHLGMKPSNPELLDYLAERFIRDGWSLKKLIALMVESATWRQSSNAAPTALASDPENLLWHHMPIRRLEAEAIRDSILAVSGYLKPQMFGPPVDPHRTAEDTNKRLFSGPLDGNGRRSIYLKMTLMEPPRFLALFNQPIPKLTVGRRDVTNVPNQALAMLNDPFVSTLARFWGNRIAGKSEKKTEERIAEMFEGAFGRPPERDELERFLAFAKRSAKMHGINDRALNDCPPVWQDVAHAIFNLKEFIYVP